MHLTLLFVSIIGVGGLANDVQSLEAKVQDIQRIWRRRQETSHSGKVTWSQRRFIKAGSIAAEPSTDLLVMTDDHCVMFLGEKVRYDSAVPVLAEGRQPSRSTIAFDGLFNKDYTPPNTFTYGFGTVWKGGQFRELNNLNTWPTTLYYRPFSASGLALDLKQFQWKDVRSFHQGGRECSCILGTGQPGTTFERYRFWVKDADPYPVLRVEKGFSAAPTVVRARLDIVYEQGASSRWTPASWLLVIMDKDGMVLETNNALVSDVQINPNLESSEFDPQFPPGTVVEDYVDGGKWIVGSQGERLPIKPGMSYDEVIYEDSRGRAVLWLTLGVLILLVTAVILRRSHGSKSR